MSRPAAVADSDRDQRFTASMTTIITGLRQVRDPHPPTARKPPFQS